MDLPSMLEFRKCPRLVSWIWLSLLVSVASGCAVTGKDTAPEVLRPVPYPPTSKVAWGAVDGKPVTLFTLTNEHGLVMKVIDYGAVITELRVPDRDGKLGDIVLGFDDLPSYVEHSPHFGSVIGRVANRISGARFELAGKAYPLAANDGKNSLHGGTKGWDRVVWEAEAIDSPAGPSVRFQYVSKDGEEGYPGTVHATNTYTLTNENELKIVMSAKTDRTTVISMAHHTYWNLAGHDSGTVLNQELRIDAAKFTPNDPQLQTAGGRIEAVMGTPFDFSKGKLIGQDLWAAGGDPIGFDANWVVDGDPHELREVLRAKDPKSGRVLTLYGDQPGVQFYTGNFLDGTLRGKGGAHYPQYAAFCIETQKFPNSVNVPDWQSEVVLEPGRVYEHTMIHAFSTE